MACAVNDSCVLPPGGVGVVSSTVSETATCCRITQSDEGPRMEVTKMQTLRGLVLTKMQRLGRLSELTRF